MGVNPGEVSITLDGKEETLKCTLRAAKTVNARGGFSKALELLQALDLDTCVMIIAAGLNKKNSEVEEAVYKAGLVDLVGPVTDFTVLLANGGRPVAERGEAPTGE